MGCDYTDRPGIERLQYPVGVQTGHANQGGYARGIGCTQQSVHFVAADPVGMLEIDHHVVETLKADQFDHLRRARQACHADLDAACKGLTSTSGVWLERISAGHTFLQNGQRALARGAVDQVFCDR